MKRNVLSLSTFLTTIIAVFFLLGSTSVIASECQIDSQNKTACLECTFEKERSVIYATGECRDACKEWGQAVSSVKGEPYRSYNYMAWNSGLRICNISTAVIYNDICPRIAGGTSECNY